MTEALYLLLIPKFPRVPLSIIEDTVEMYRETSSFKYICNILEEWEIQNLL